MAFLVFSSSSSVAPAAPSIAFSVSKKLTRNNHPLWRAQVLAAIRGAQLASFISPTTKPPSPFLDPGDDKKAKPKPNPNYDPWVAKDQQVLSFILRRCPGKSLVRCPLPKLLLQLGPQSRECLHPSVVLESLEREWL
jgi:hypothetical protein